MSDLMKRIRSIGIVPVIALEEVEDAAPLAKALCDGGLPIAEVTYRTACAHDAMIEMKKACPQMLVGAGTVLTKEQVDSALDAGAEFIVSPGLNPEIVKYCQLKGVPILPGCANASDIESALSLGLEVVKFFPAESLGGLPMIKALAAPYTKMKFMPTGGVNAKNIKDYLAFNKIVACGGTWMVDATAMKAKDFDKITTLTREAVQTMLGLTIKHIGINCSNNDGMDVATKFATLFGGAVTETSKGFFGSSLIEVLNESNHLGTHGHIAMGCQDSERAMHYFENLGFTFDESTIAYDANGNIKFVYFNEEIGGFRIHLINN